MADVVKVLIVTDSGAGGYLETDRAVHPDPAAFHLGEFVRVLESTNWIGFDVEITKAHRSSRPSGEDIAAFRFDEGSLDEFDMLFLFGILRRTRITDGEAAVIARFMDAGGGVFATGDHEDLGAGLADKVPRVRSMRRWYWSESDAANQFGPNGEPVAPIGTPLASDDPLWPLLTNRHDTVRRGFDEDYQFSDQSDRIAQEIAPTWYQKFGNPTLGGVSSIFGRPYPHPLLCSPIGVVRHLPDHPHEGVCEVPSDTQLSASWSMGGYTTEEYPRAADGRRVLPEVVATATVIGGHTTVGDVVDGLDKPITQGREFGVIGAWDGHRVERGRVVVDATWHHFFNVNLTGETGAAADEVDDAKLYGFHAPPQPNRHYEEIKWYFRNIVYWLVPRSRRTSILVADLARVARTHWAFVEEFPQRRSLANRFDLPIAQAYAWIASRYFDQARGACARREVFELMASATGTGARLGDLLDPWAPAPDGRLDTATAAIGLRLAEDVLLGAVFGTIAEWALDHDDPVTDAVTERLFGAALDVSDAALAAIDDRLAAEVQSLETLRQVLRDDSAEYG